MNVLSEDRICWTMGDNFPSVYLSILIGPLMCDGCVAVKGGWSLVNHCG